ncbi:hypothetical protein EYF80_037452 [Liparis tanakae]|uniref:Uncharacterized protein n=1 Tax=Liparis tanakae TaxID=230148 RepID=A0A4Z2GG36_9TELE|nr:hypothetical protein EYF80_037452 [Liparis tanakae]
MIWSSGVTGGVSLSSISTSMFSSPSSSRSSFTSSLVLSSRARGCNSVTASPLHHSFPRLGVRELTLFDVHLLAAEPLGELLAVPHQQLLAGLHRADGVEVDVAAVLAGHQVLLGQSAGRVDVAHPVAPVDVVAIHEVLELPAAVDLQRRDGGIKTTHAFQPTDSCI